MADLEDKPYTTRPYPPFTTSTLQQEANRKYGFTARQTMQVAQSLYENGPHHLHADRLDQPGRRWRSRPPATWSPRSTAASTCPPQPRVYQTKVKNAQEAHEAIRPAGHPFDFPETLRARAQPRRSSSSTT